VVEQALKARSDEGSAESEASGSGKLCFRVDEDVKRVWSSLSRADKLALTRFFRDVIVSYSTTKSIVGLGIRDVAELASILKVGYESCKDALKRCEERCRDVDSVRAEYRAKIKEDEETVEQLRAEATKKDAEMAKLRAQLMSLSNLSKLRLLVCTLIEQDKMLEEALKKCGLSNICQ
jgi:transposase